MEDLICLLATVRTLNYKSTVGRTCALSVFINNQIVPDTICSVLPLPCPHCSHQLCPRDLHIGYWLQATYPFIAHLKHQDFLIFMSQIAWEVIY